MSKNIHNTKKPGKWRFDNLRGEGNQRFVGKKRAREIEVQKSGKK
jgi:hypothetical protein